MVNIAFAIDKSEAYVNFQKNKLIDDWGLAGSDIKYIEKIGEAGIATLFGSAPVSVLHFETKEEIQEAFNIISKASKSELERFATPGLIMLTDVDRRSTAKMEKFLTGIGGEVRVAKEKSSDKTPVTRTLLNDLNLSRDVKNFIEDYVGDDYTAALGLIRTLGNLTREQQRAISIDEVALRLPTPPGGVPPWEIEKPLFAGDVSKTIELYRRIANASHYLVVLTIIKNKFSLAWKVNSLQVLNPSIQKAEIASALGVPNNYPLQIAMGYSKDYGEKKLKNILEEIALVESKVKGGSAVDSDSLMEILLVKIMNVLRN